MEFDFIDNYLLDERPAKADTIRQILAQRSALSAAAPFYRALETLGVRAADEAIMALRLVLAGKTPTDERVKRMRDVVTSSRSAPDGARDRVRDEYERAMR
ncbi:MAG: hypothetical protein GIW98_04910 [Candidatus Eremiobacteraeota bacterium]|nr:hypothetical protein [Candidatus Eremiobacteraeota bacterium]